MRLSDKQIEIICRALKKYFGEPSRIWLFGSRVDDHQRGGDIDLYIETPLQKADEVIDAKLRALAEIKAALGDQKIDLVMHRQGQTHEPIHWEARNTGIQLY